MKSSIRARVEVWIGTLIIIVACIIMRYSIPGALRSVVFVATIAVALYLIAVSFGHAKRNDG